MSRAFSTSSSYSNEKLACGAGSLKNPPNPVTITATVDANAITTATVAVDRDRLDEAGVAPDRLAVYHGTGDGWVATETTVTDADDETVRIAADSEGFSAFAVAVERPALTPETATLSAETVAPGEKIHVDVTLASVGPAPATDEPLELRAEPAADEGPEDGASTEAESEVASEPLAVDAAPSEAATGSVTLTVDDAGEYDLVVDGDAVPASTTVDGVTVTDSTDAGATIGTGVGDADSRDADGGAVEEVTGLDLSDLAGLVALVAIVLATLVLVRRAPR